MSSVEDVPSVSPAARGDAVEAKAALGLAGRVRLKVAVVVLFVGILLVPPSLRDAFNDLEVSSPDEEE
ncbi:ORF 18 [Haloarcula hispanica virus SH1]|uniref:ORF 18 n=1 Tax=Haloarcula hispanica SH1 virus TaxID=326574 RepID=Q4KPG9_9VIRU|nr:ORF 18 [Haloarcula hispanica virus SH1]AAY24944.1 ORF 18 [Haloarcula hispanica virus SH1]